MFNDVIRCTTYDLLKIKNKLGQIYFCTDNLVLYRDNGFSDTERTRFNAKVLSTENERIKSKPEQGKYYYVIETNGLWLFENRWSAQTPNIAKYNSYTMTNQILSPVINTNEEITSSLTGDKIIDNNGLLGNGTIVIRDGNRIIKNTMEVNNVSQQIQNKSYVDDGFVFIPNANLPYANLNEGFGALHLTTEIVKPYSTNSSNNIKGMAYYYGDFNTYGNVYTITKQENANVKPDYIPEGNDTLKIFIELNKLLLVNETSKLLKTYITIIPLNKTEADISIIQFYNEDNKSVVVNDVGDYIYTGYEDLLISTKFTTNRKYTINNAKGINQCDYYLSEFDYTITFKQINDVTTCIVPTQWSDASSIVTYNNVIYTKDQLISSSMMKSTINDLLKQIDDLKKEVKALKN